MTTTSAGKYLPLPSPAIEPAEPASEVVAIEHLVATLEHAQRNELVDDFVGLFREDAVWTTAHGHRLTGRDEIAAFTRKVLPGAMTDTTVSYRVVDVTWLRPDVAAVRAESQYATLTGVPTDVFTPLYVMTKESGAWKLAACQNTGVLTG